METAEKFIISAFAGDLSRTVRYLNEGVSVDAQDCEGVTALQAASVGGQDDVVKYLLSNSADVDLSNAYGWTPLMLAARHGHSTTLSLLLKHRARVNVFNKLGLTPIAAATWSGQISSVKLLLEAGAVVDQVPVGEEGLSECDLTPLMIASLLGHDAILQILLERGAPVNQLSSVTGWSPLMLASSNGHKQIVQILLQWGANFNINDVCGRNALDVALFQGQRDVKVLLENMSLTCAASASGKEAELLEAVRNGDAFRVKLILKEYKRSANSVDPVDGVSALMIASMLGYIDIVQSLVCSGSDINAQDTSNGWTPLMHAVFYKQSEVVKYILERGADIYIRANNGYTVLDLAKYLDNSDRDIISALNSKVKTTSEFSEVELTCSTALLPVSSRRKNHSVDSRICSKRSPQSSRLKGWFGSMANRFQTVLPKASPRATLSANAVPSISVDATADLNDDVFGKSTSSDNSAPSKAMLSLSALKSPNRYLANNLRKHSMEPITPPLLSSPSRSIAPKDILLCRKQKGRAVSLKTPNLLKNYTKSCSSVSQGSNYSLDKSCRLPPSGKVGSLRLDIEFPKSSQVSVSNAEQTSLRCPESPAVSLDNTSIQEDGAVSEDPSADGQGLGTLGGLSQILKAESLQKHIKKFKEQEVDLEALKCLTEDDLDEIGINTNVSREKLLEIINNLNALNFNVNVP